MGYVESKYHQTAPQRLCAICFYTQTKEEKNMNRTQAQRLVKARQRYYDKQKRRAQTDDHAQQMYAASVFQAMAAQGAVTPIPKEKETIQ